MNKKKMKKHINKNVIKALSKPVEKSFSSKMDRPDKFNYCEYNNIISQKFYKFLDLSLRLPYNVTFETDKIIMDLKLDEFRKNFSKNSNKVSKMNDMDDFMTITISKKGFKINKSYGDIIGYIDENIYDLYLEKIKEYYKTQMAQTFNMVIDEVMEISSIGREFKINSILED